MMIDQFALASFVLVTTFTPGPNNISSASMGIIYGYGKTFRYLTGIAGGFFLVMLICATLSTQLLETLPALEKYLRLIGAGYILWLAVTTLRTSYSFSASDQPPQAFKKGFLLQLLNPKVAIYGLTLYSTLLAPISGKIEYLAVSALLLAATAFCATSTWALFGAAIKNSLHNDSFRRFINLALAALLAYTALDLSGLIV